MSWPAEGFKPIEWWHLTNRTVATLERVDRCRAGWEVEPLFLVLSEGCRVEALPLSSGEPLERGLAVLLVVARRECRRMRLGRTMSDLDAPLLFEPEEWQAADSPRKKAIPKTAPRPNDAIGLSTRLGGFLARKRNDGSSVGTIRLGLRRVADFAAGIR